MRTDQMPAILSRVYFGLKGAKEMPQNAQQNGHRGAVLLVVLICVLLVSMTGTSLIRLGLLQYKQTLQEENHVQAIWLAEAGLERAVTRLRATPKYTGETWTIESNSFAKELTGSVQIEIAPVLDKPATRRVTIVSTYPVKQEHRARVTKTLTVAVP